MITYLKAKKDLNNIIEFNYAVIALWEIENKAEEELSRGYNRYILHSEKKKAIDELSVENSNYQNIRANVSKYILEAMKIGKKHKIPLDFTSYPAPAVGGAVIPVNIFYAVLFDNSYQGISKQMVIDVISQIIGACDKKVKDEFINLVNPLSWFKSLIVFMLRIPFVIIEATGFCAEKVEDHFLGKMIKLFEIIFIIYKIGIEKSEIINTLKV